MHLRIATINVTAIVSALTQAALFGIIITLAIIELPIERLRNYILATSALNGLLLLTLLTITAKVLSDQTALTIPELCYTACSYALSLVAQALSLYVLASIWRAYHFNLSSLNTSTTAVLVVTGLITCCVTLLTQSTTHILLLSWRRNVAETRESTSTGSPKPYTVNLRSIPSSPGRSQLTPYSPSASLHSLKSSRQGSVSQVFGPLGSKTRLLLAQSLHNEKREPSLEIACRGDISALTDSEPYELSSSPPLRMNLSRTMLETIPGSRPVSPAKPLDGPYYEEVSPEDFPLPVSPSLSRTTSPVYSSSQEHMHSLPFPPMIGEFASQSHIHPLFRSGSPGPPPSTTPGTTVTASPYAGQIISSEHVTRRLKSAQSSRSPTPRLSPVPSLERSESIPNFSRPSRAGPSKADMF